MGIESLRSEGCATYTLVGFVYIYSHQVAYTNPTRVYGAHPSERSDSIFLKDSLKDPLKDSLKDSLKNFLKDSLTDFLKDPLKNPLKDFLKDFLRISQISKRFVNFPGALLARVPATGPGPKKGGGPPVRVRKGPPPPPGGGGKTRGPGKKTQGRG